MRRRALRSAKCLSLVAVCLSAGVASSASAAEARYLYVLDCSARVQKLDMTTGRTTASTALAQRSTLVPTHGDAANSVPDGCATYGAAYSAKAHLLYTVAPLTGSFHGTPRRYRVLTFRLPGLHAGPVIELQDAFSDDEAPVLEGDAGAIALSGAGRTWRLVGRHFIAVSAALRALPDSRPPTRTDPFHQLDPSRYRMADDGLSARRDNVAYTPLERAGAVVLVQFIGSGGRRGVCHRESARKDVHPVGDPVPDGRRARPPGAGRQGRRRAGGASGRSAGAGGHHRSHGRDRCRERQGRPGVDGVLGGRLVPADGHAGGAVGVLSWRRDATAAAHGRAASGRGRRPAARHRAGVFYADR